MAELLKLQEIKCPNCQKPITSLSPFKATVTCPRCGHVSKNPIASESSLPKPERIIPFTTDESAFENAMINSLINTDYVDKNVFDGINTDNVFRAYLPMYLYEGTYNAAWSCESSYEDEKVSVSSNWTNNGKTVSTKKVKKWRPQNGNAAGNFSFLCLANESENDLPEELRAFTTRFPYEVMDSKSFSPELISDEDERLISIPMNADANIIWQKHGKDRVDQVAEEAALIQIGNQEIRNFRASSSFQLTTKGDYILAPFWFVYYNYKNQRYHFLMDGLGRNVSGNYPIDEEDVAFTDSKEKIKKIVKWLWLLALVVMYFAGFKVGLVALGIWFIAKIVVGKVMDNQIKARLEESRSIRQAAASRLS